MDEMKDLKDVSQAFPHGIQASTPANASPFEMDINTFGKRFAKNAHRQRLFQGLRDCIQWHDNQGRHIAFLMIGGSFLSNRLTPKDVDGVFFYQLAPNAQIPEGLRDWQKQLWPELDMRHCPIDADPKLVCRVSAYFSLLFSQSKDKISNTSKGSVIVTLE